MIVLCVNRKGYSHDFVTNYQGNLKQGEGSDSLKTALETRGQYFQTSTAVNYESRLIFYESGIFILLFITFNLRP